jgi:putative DNA-invertase from lambdoid prophage Rac
VGIPNEVNSAGFAVQPSRIIPEAISGSAPAAQQPAFRRLGDRLETDNVLVVTKPDRLRRKAMYVLTTVDALATTGGQGSPSRLGRGRPDQLGRPASLNKKQKLQIVARLDAGSSISGLAREDQTSRQTIIQSRFRPTSPPDDRTV